MTSYWLTNIVLSALVLAGLLLLRSAPPRPKMWMCLIAAAAWCIPWSTLSLLWQSNDVFVRYIRVETLQALPLPVTALAPVSAAVPVPWEWILAGVTAVGLFLFMARVAKHQRQLTAWRKDAKPATDVWRRAGYADISVPILIVDGLENAFVSGYRHPKIWMGPSQLASGALPGILQHELAHIRQHDNLILLFATLLTDLFWWNPLVRVLMRQARRYVELSCDLACQKSSPEYRQNLASELLNREYRMLESRLINPISRNRGFNVYRIRQLATETSMKLRHLFLFGLLTVASVLLISNIAVSQESDDEQKIVNHLKISTTTATVDDDGREIQRGVRSLETEFIGEPEAEKILRAARAANVQLHTHMENEFRRVIVIESRDVLETHKVLTAVERSGLGNVLSQFADGDSGRKIFLDLDFKPLAEAPLSITLAPTVGHWTGVTAGDYLLRIKSDLLGDHGQQTVLLSMEISQKTGEAAFDLLATPRVQAKLGHEAVVQFGYEVVSEGGEQDRIVSLTVVPRLTL